MIIEFPKEFNAKSLHTIWRSVSALKNRMRERKVEVALDLSAIGFMDAVGANYVALLPTFLSKAGVTPTILLPRKPNVLRFLDQLGLLEHFYQTYRVQPSRRALPFDARTGALAGFHETFISKNAQTYVCERENMPSLFRHEVIRHHMFALDGTVALACCESIFELVNNVFDHSGEAAGCVTIQFRRSSSINRSEAIEAVDQLFIAVSDLGVGIRGSFQSSGVPGRSVADDCFYIDQALNPGVSSSGLIGRGHGLPTVVRLAQRTRLSSGHGTVAVDRRRGTSRRTARQGHYVPGTSAFLIFDIPPREKKRPSRRSSKQEKLDL